MTQTEQPGTTAKNGLVRHVVIPVVALAMIIVPSFRILQSSRHPGLQGRLTCQIDRIKNDLGAADVLFLGSSRTGAAIDTVVMADHFEGDLENADKVALTSGSEFDRDLSYRTYTKYRGVPRVLAIELSFFRYSKVEPPPLLTPTSRSYTLFETDVYAEMLSSLRSNGQADLADTYLRSKFVSTGSYFFGRLGTGADFALRSPRTALSLDDTCTWGSKPIRAKWVLGDSEPFVEGETKVPSKRQQERWTRGVAKLKSMDLEDPYTASEILLLQNLVATAYADGVEEVVLFYLPTVAELPGVIDLEGVARLVPDVSIMDARSVLLDDSRPTLRWQYPNQNHVNRFAAYEISVAFAALLDEVTR